MALLEPHVVCMHVCSPLQKQRICSCPHNDTAVVLCNQGCGGKIPRTVDEKPFEASAVLLSRKGSLVRVV